jgi:GTPase Era involved in 16S rRNA processing
MQTSNQKYPRFAVVGHPNKGKSSIVSTLAYDESVHISTVPGTTTQQRSYPLTIDGVTLYALFDTPGFQRSRALLAWLTEVEVPAHKRVDRVKRFIYEHRDNPRYNDEVELLEPILAGAGIIYVVDGSKPYGVEYEAEMQILEWCGQPSMALINLIDDTNYVDEWKRALQHYFQMVRLFNPMEANFTQHIALLESMAQLREEWTSSIKESITIFQAYHQQKITDTAESITQLQIDALSYVASKSIDDQEASDVDRDLLMQKYKDSLRAIEKKSHQKIAKIWSHQLLEKESELPLLDQMDLFSKESESLFGLSKKELIVTGMAGGALTGSGVDMLLAGSSLMLGSAIGAVVGGASVMFGYDEVADMKLLGWKLGRRELQVGPIQNPNFPYILLQRTLYYAIEIASRPHADRSKINMDRNSLLSENFIDDASKKRLEKIHQALRKSKVIKEEAFEEYVLIIRKVLVDRVG